MAATGGADPEHEHLQASRETEPQAYSPKAALQTEKHAPLQIPRKTE